MARYRPPCHRFPSIDLSKPPLVLRVPLPSNLTFLENDAEVGSGQQLTSVLSTRRIEMAASLSVATAFQIFWRIIGAKPSVASSRTSSFGWASVRDRWTASAVHRLRALWPVDGDVSAKRGKRASIRPTVQSPGLAVASRPWRTRCPGAGD